MTCSDWINLGVAIGTILLATIAAITTFLSFKERRRISALRNDAMLINVIIDWTNNLKEFLDSTDDKQLIRDFFIDFQPFIFPTENITDIVEHFAKKYPILGKSLNNEIEKLLSPEGPLYRINKAFANAVELEKKSKKHISINNVFKEKGSDLTNTFTAIRNILSTCNTIKTQHLFTI